MHPVNHICGITAGGWREGAEQHQSLTLYTTSCSCCMCFPCRHYDLDQLLDPRSITSDPLDCRLSWHLWEVLRALNYTHLSQQSQGVLNTSYAAQLESEGFWEWAVFILLHEPKTQ